MQDVFPDANDRKDAYQEVVYQAWKSYPTFKGESKFSTWIYRVALNTAITHIRKSKKELLREPLDDLAFAPDSSFEEEQLNKLYDAIGTLSPVDKGIIFMHLEGESYEEIALVTGLSKSNVSVRLVRIKRKLEEKLRATTK